MEPGRAPRYELFITLVACCATQEEITSLKADIDKGLAKVAAGRISEFNTDCIIERGRALLAARNPSA